MNLAEGAKALTAIPEQVLDALAPVPYATLKALVAWVEHADDDHPEPEALTTLPTKLRSELALARAEARAKAAQAAPQG